jgi:hypothetical protein
LPFSGVPNYPQNPLDFSPLSTYFFNIQPPNLLGGLLATAESTQDMLFTKRENIEPIDAKRHPRVLLPWLRTGDPKP